MKLLQRILTNVPDQVLSTAIILGIGYVFCRGCVAVWNDPPSSTAILVILGAGVFCGLYVALMPHTNPTNKETDTND